MGEGVWPNRHITLIGPKKLNLQFILPYLRCLWGLVDNVIWGGRRERLNTVIYRERGLKLFKKTSYDI